MCFYDKFAALCKKKGVSETRALIEAGLSKSLRTKWMNKPATVPNGESLTKLSKYFNVPADYFMDLDIKKEPTSNRSELISSIIELFNQLTPEEAAKVLAYTQGVIDNRAD